MSGSDERPPPNGRDAEPDDLPSLSLDDAPSEPFDARALADLLGDRYAPVSRLGEGTFGEVFRARDGVLGREVAVKRVRLEAFTAPGQLEEVKTRFLREAQVAARLRHPNIVTTHDIVSTPRSSFIVMELVEGRDLSSLLQERGRLSLDETLDVLGQVAAALDHAHACGVVHRDVKPANVMIEPSGHVKVMDFGIAKAEQGGNLTATGLIVGTPNYMPPEQARGGKADARADVFSLGCVLYECLSGRKPFADESLTAILLKVVTEPAPPLDYETLGLPRALDGVLRKAMAKEPARRFASPGELIDAARRASRGVEVGAPPVGPSGTLVTTPADAASATPPRMPGGLATVSSVPREPRAPRAEWRRFSWPRAALAAAVVAGGVFGVLALRARNASLPTPVGAEARLVVEEEPGFLGRLLGRPPRLLITVPGETTLSLEMRTAISSATARPGDEVTAALVHPVTIEGQEAIGAGARVHGQVTRAEPAKEAGGRGRLGLDFDAVVLGDGASVRIQADAVELTAPPPKPATSHRKGLAGAWSKVTETVGGIVREAKGNAGQGVAGARVVESRSGVDIEVPAGSRLDVDLTRSVTIARARDR